MGGCGRVQAGAGEWLRAGGCAGGCRGARGCGWVRVLSKKNECIALACACVWEGYIQIFIGSASLVQLPQAGRVHASLHLNRNTGGPKNGSKKGAGKFQSGGPKQVREK